MERKKWNSRGILSSSPKGYGYVTQKGYLRKWDIKQKRYRLEHNIVWEEHFGKIPENYQIHHKDGNKLNNDINNLELVSPIYHKRIHSGCELRNGFWWKPCKKCGVFQPITEYYKRVDGISSRCKKCSIKNSIENKRKMR